MAKSLQLLNDYKMMVPKDGALEGKEIAFTQKSSRKKKGNNKPDSPTSVISCNTCGKEGLTIKMFPYCKSGVNEDTKFTKTKKNNDDDKPSESKKGKGRIYLSPRMVTVPIPIASRIIHSLVSCSTR